MEATLVRSVLAKLALHNFHTNHASKDWIKTNKWNNITVVGDFFITEVLVKPWNTILMAAICDFCSCCLILNNAIYL